MRRRIRKSGGQPDRPRIDRSRWSVRATQSWLHSSPVRGRHFPRAADGKYAGHHPADGAEAVAHLGGDSQEQGADYFLLPSTYFWWLGYPEGLAKHLQSRYRLVADSPDACLIYDLRSGPLGLPRNARCDRAGRPPEQHQRRSVCLIRSCRRSELSLTACCRLLSSRCSSSARVTTSYCALAATALRFPP